jgi:membrane associated rhomboid family serine protease
MIPTGGPFSSIERNFSQLSRSPMTWFWVLSIVGIEALVVAVGGPNRQPAWTWYEWLGLSREGILSGKIWQLLSYGLLHGNWLHTGVNALFLLLVGSRIEYIAGAVTMARATILGVLGGAIGHLALTSGAQDAPLLVGMSGGCMGLLLVMTTLSPQSRMLPLPVSGRSLGIGVILAELILALADPALGVPGFRQVGDWLVRNGMGHWFQMGHACHFGGGVAGWLFGRWLLRPRITLERLRRDRERRET